MACRDAHVERGLALFVLRVDVNTRLGNEVGERDFLSTES